jgi:hypothetical protein
LGICSVKKSLFPFFPDKFLVRSSFGGEGCAWGNYGRGEGVDASSDFFYSEALIVELLFESLIICFLREWVEGKLNKPMGGV